MEIRKTVEEELRVQVDTGKDYCVVAVSLGLQVERLGKAIAFEFMDSKVTEAENWREGNGMKEKEKGK